MKAKDTAIHLDIQNKSLEVAMRGILETQAEVSFQAGIREVVGWIDEYSRMTYERDKGEVTFNHVQWHTKLKEWGIE